MNSKDSVSRLDILHWYMGSDYCIYLPPVQRFLGKEILSSALRRSVSVFRDIEVRQNDNHRLQVAKSMARASAQE